MEITSSGLNQVLADMCLQIRQITGPDTSDLDIQDVLAAMIASSVSVEPVIVRDVLVLIELRNSRRKSNEKTPSGGPLM